MNILFIHQNMPGQFGRLAQALAAVRGNRCVFVTRRADVALPGVERVNYTLSLPPVHHLPIASRPFNHQVLFGEAVARACQALKGRGFAPDVVLGHPGWGELLFVKDVFPNAKLISYCEFYHRPNTRLLQGDPPRRLTLDEEMSRRAQSAHLLLSLEAADRGWSPTHWQRGLHPSSLQSKIVVIGDGVDTEAIFPDNRAVLELAGSCGPFSAEDEVITFAARSLEPSRGFPAFIRALPEVLRRRPQARVVIAGLAAPHYDGPPADARTWRDHVVKEVQLDSNRVHFVGRLSRRDFTKLLQISSLHVHLSSPTVISWSLLEAMAAGCLILGSPTPPNLEFLEAGQNGLLTSGEGDRGLSQDICDALTSSVAQDLRRSARQTAEALLSLTVCLPQQLELINGCI